MIRRPPRSTLDRSSAASDVYKRQAIDRVDGGGDFFTEKIAGMGQNRCDAGARRACAAVSYTHLRAHETVLDIVCRLLLEKKKYAHH